MPAQFEILITPSTPGSPFLGFGPPSPPYVSPVPAAIAEPAAHTASTPRTSRSPRTPIRSGRVCRRGGRTERVPRRFALALRRLAARSSGLVSAVSRQSHRGDVAVQMSDFEDINDVLQDLAAEAYQLMDRLPGRGRPRRSCTRNR